MIKKWERSKSSNVVLFNYYLVLLVECSVSSTLPRFCFTCFTTIVSTICQSCSFCDAAFFLSFREVWLAWNGIYHSRGKWDQSGATSRGDGRGQTRQHWRDCSPVVVALREPGGVPFRSIDTTAMLPMAMHLPRSSNYLPTTASLWKLSLIRKLVINLMGSFFFLLQG